MSFTDNRQRRQSLVAALTHSGMIANSNKCVHADGRRMAEQSFYNNQQSLTKRFSSCNSELLPHLHSSTGAELENKLQDGFTETQQSVPFTYMFLVFFCSSQ